MAMQEQERRSLPLETARTTSDKPQLPRFGPITGGSAATMATDGMTTYAGTGWEAQGLEGTPDNIHSSSPSVDLLSVAGRMRPCSSQIFAYPHFQRKPRSRVPRTMPSHSWGFKPPVLAPAPTKKMAKKRRACVLCEVSKTPRWRTWPTDQRVMLCNACGIRVRTPGLVLPELLYLPHPVTASTTVVSNLEQPVAPPQEIIQVSDSLGAPLPEKVCVDLPPPATATTMVDFEPEQPPPQEIEDPESPPDSPIQESMKDVDVCLLRRTLPRRVKSPPPPPTPMMMMTAAESAMAASGNEKDTLKKWCLHCGNTSTPQWRKGPLGESTLCNACGVHYRKGRLVPEYRPRASPTFNKLEHSYKHWAAAAPAPGNEIDKPEKCCLHCGIASTPQWRTGPLGESTLCNACDMCYRKGALLSEYRPRASPTFNLLKHSYKHRELLEIRKKQEHRPEPASFKLIRTRKHRKGKGQQEPAQSSQEAQGQQGAEPACTERKQPAQSATSLPISMTDDEPAIVIVIDDD